MLMSISSISATQYWVFVDPSKSSTKFLQINKLTSPTSLDTDPDNVKQCVGGEDPTCSDSIPSTGINPAHLTYFGQSIIILFLSFYKCLILSSSHCAQPYSLYLRRKVQCRKEKGKVEDVKGFNVRFFLFICIPISEKRTLFTFWANFCLSLTLEGYVSMRLGYHLRAVGSTRPPPLSLLIKVSLLTYAYGEVISKSSLIPTLGEKPLV